MQNKEEYPIKKYDYLNRLIYINWNGTERVINRYWGTSTNIKIKYRIFGKDINTEAYSESGKQIIDYSKGKHDIILERINFNYKGLVSFCVERRKINEWKKIAKK